MLDLADQESISRPGQIIQAIPADLTRSCTSTEALEKASVAHGGRTPDHVYLCAGSSRPKFMLDSSEEEFKGVHIFHYLLHEVELINRD
jgi:3-dehydrosphinganine reductase